MRNELELMIGLKLDHISDEKLLNGWHGIKTRFHY